MFINVNTALDVFLFLAGKILRNKWMSLQHHLFTVRVNQQRGIRSNIIIIGTTLHLFWRMMKRLQVFVCCFDCLFICLFVGCLVVCLFLAAVPKSYCPVLLCHTFCIFRTACQRQNKA